MLKQIISRNLNSLCADVQVELCYKLGMGLARLSNQPCMEKVPSEVREVVERFADVYTDIDFLNDVRATSLNLPFPTSVQNIKNRFEIGKDFAQRWMTVLENESK